MASSRKKSDTLASWLHLYCCRTHRRHADRKLATRTSKAPCLLETGFKLSQPCYLESQTTNNNSRKQLRIKKKRREENKESSEKTITQTYLPIYTVFTPKKEQYPSPCLRTHMTSLPLRRSSTKTKTEMAEGHEFPVLFTIEGSSRHEGKNPSDPIHPCHFLRL